MAGRNRSTDQPISNSRADKAGDVLRQWYLYGDSAVSWEDALEAYGTAELYRSMHAYPLRKVTVGLRQFVKREAEQISVAQRFKRMDRIVEKLARFHRMRLSQMEDIGGCRAILAHTDEVARVARRIHQRWDVVRTYDYVARPKSSGYGHSTSS